MSYRCEGPCRRKKGPGSKPIRIVTKTRAKVYPPRYVNGEMVDKGGEGREIVEEKNFCPDCARR